MHYLNIYITQLRHSSDDLIVRNIYIGILWVFILKRDQVFPGWLLSTMFHLPRSSTSIKFNDIICKLWDIVWRIKNLVSTLI